MSFGFMDGVFVTIAAMAMVFFVLLLIYAAIRLISYGVNQTSQPAPTKPSVASPPVTPAVQGRPLFEQSENAKVAAVMALIKASEKYPDAQFEVVSIEKK